MINVVIPLVGTSQFFDDVQYKYPKPLIEINGATMIELFLKNFNKMRKKVHFIFILNEDDCRRFHLDNILNILTSNNCDIIKIGAPTKGAACSVLMAVDLIDNGNPLIISNADQYFDIPLEEAISCLESSDAGVIIFDSIHPRWSYVKLDNKNNIVETAEKNPISNHAVAGFYYFTEGKSFVRAAMSMVKKDASVNGMYYISPVFNELILENKKLGVYPIEKSKYHTFYNPQKIKDYERLNDY